MQKSVIGQTFTVRYPFGTSHGPIETSWKSRSNQNACRTRDRRKSEGATGHSLLQSRLTAWSWMEDQSATRISRGSSALPLASGDIQSAVWQRSMARAGQCCRGVSGFRRGVVATAHPVTIREVRSGKLLPDQRSPPNLRHRERNLARRAPARAWGAVTDPSLRQTIDGWNRRTNSPQLCR